VPEFVDEWVHELLRWCWQSDLVARPTFKEILSFLEANSNIEYIRVATEEKLS
jgi:hypothetical protein